MQNLKKTWSVVSKVSKICAFICYYCAKYLMFDLKKYRGVIFHDPEQWCKIWRKTDMWFGKWHEVYSKFPPEHLKVSKLGLGSFNLKKKRYELKSYKRVEMKNDAKF